MQTVVVDQKGRILLPKKLRAKLKLKSNNRLMVESSENERIVFKLVKSSGKNRELLWLLNNPLHVSKDLIKKINLEKLENEMWMP